MTTKLDTFFHFEPTPIYYLPGLSQYAIIHAISEVVLQYKNNA